MVQCQRNPACQGKPKIKKTKNRNIQHPHTGANHED